MLNKLSLLVLPVLVVGLMVSATEVSAEEESWEDIIASLGDSVEAVNYDGQIGILSDDDAVNEVVQEKLASIFGSPTVKFLPNGSKVFVPPQSKGY